MEVYHNCAVCGIGRKKVKMWKLHLKINTFPTKKRTVIIPDQQERYQKPRLSHESSAVILHKMLQSRPHGICALSQFPCWEDLKRGYNIHDKEKWKCTICDWLDVDISWIAVHFVHLVEMKHVFSMFTKSNQIIFVINDYNGTLKCAVKDFAVILL